MKQDIDMEKIREIEKNIKLLLMKMADEEISQSELKRSLEKEMAITTQGEWKYLRSWVKRSEHEAKDEIDFINRIKRIAGAE